MNHHRHRSTATKNIGKRNSMEPGPTDIICGRGKKIQQRPGNVMFQNMILTWSSEFDEDAKTSLGRQRLAREIIRSIRSQSPPGRFLELDSSTGQWKDIGDHKAFQKVKQALRDRVMTPFSSKKESSSKETSSSSVMVQNKEKSLAQNGKSSGVSPSPTCFTPVVEPLCVSMRQDRSEFVVSPITLDEESYPSIDPGRSLESSFNSDTRLYDIESLARLPTKNVDNSLFPLFADESWKNVDEWELDILSLLSE